MSNHEIPAAVVAHFTIAYAEEIAKVDSLRATLAKMEAGTVIFTPRRYDAVLADIAALQNVIPFPY